MPGPGSMKRGARRGQALVLWALTLLLLSLMVLITLGTAMRTKEATELQMAADAAAYSQAVAVARTFNAISVMNRAQVAAMVAVAGTQAQISYSGVLLAGVSAKCPGEYPDLMKNYWEADQAAALQVSALTGVAGSLFSGGVELYNALVRELLNDQQLGQKIAGAANAELRAPAKGDFKTMREVNGGNYVMSPKDISKKSVAKDSSVFECSGVVCLVGTQGLHALYATMGSLGWTWVRNRSAGGGITQGSAGFGATMMTSPAVQNYGWASQMDPMTYDSINGRNAWGHDHLQRFVPPCANLDPSDPDSYVSTSDAWVMSNEYQSRFDQHVIPRYTDSGAYNAEVPGKVTWEVHTLGPCAWCPGIWPSMIHWNASAANSAGPKNDYAQPKLYSILERDFAKRTFEDPWNLAFRLRTGGKLGSEFDNASTDGLKKRAADTVLRTQVALSSAVVYYHRQAVDGNRDDAWREPANFMNPFWRATLSSPVGSADDDPAEALERAGQREHAEALRGLIGAGYRGMGQLK